MTHDELEREIDRLRLEVGKCNKIIMGDLATRLAEADVANALRSAFAKERADHAATHGILDRVRAGLMSAARDSDQRHAVELAFSLLAGGEGNDAAVSAQTVATALLVAVNGWSECREAHAGIIARLDSLAGVP